MAFWSAWSRNWARSRAGDRHRRPGAHDRRRTRATSARSTICSRWKACAFSSSAIALPARAAAPQLRRDRAQLLQLLHRDRRALPAAPRIDSFAFDAGLGADRNVARGRHSAGSGVARHRRAFDKYEARQKRGRMRRVNGLAWCAQAVMEAAEEMRRPRRALRLPAAPSANRASSTNAWPRI